MGGVDVADRTDRMFDEVDRQLEFVRAQAEGLATRAGILFSVAAVATAVLAARIDELKHGLVISLWTLGLAILLGVAVLIPLLARGPGITNLSAWALEQDESVALSKLYAAKTLTLDGNRARVTVMTVLFYLQAAAAVASVGIALVVVGQG
jgi:hypothetical protein